MKQVDARHLRHHKIAEDDVEGLAGRDARDGIVRVLNHEDLVLALQDASDRAADRGLVDVATDQASDASVDLGADADECPPGQSRSCRCGDSGVGGAVCTDEACVYDPGLSGALRP